MTFDAVLNEIRDLLQREGRVSYRALKRRFTIDDEYIEDLKAELIDAKHLAVDEDGKVLVWIGAAPVPSSEVRVSSSPQPLTPSTQHPAERRQLTVMFCDLVGSTALSAQLDPEELREVIRHYQHTSATVIARFDGHIAQYLGDGLLVYFGYPVAHEDDAARAVRAGLEIIAALQPLALRHEVPSPFQGEGQGEGGAIADCGMPIVEEKSQNDFPSVPNSAFATPQLQVRIGIHTGLVVIGEVGSHEKHEMLALGETPNIAARIQGQAGPDEVVVSSATYRLVEGLFEAEDRGQPVLKGVTTPLTLYHVCSESVAHSRFETSMQRGLTPLVGREEELALLRRRWEQAKEGEGQVVLLSGEAGIGKSRLVQELKDAVSREGAVRIEFRCSPYHQNSALYSIIDHLHRLLRFTPEDTPRNKLDKLQQALTRYRFPRAETLALFATLLSLPQPEGIPPLALSPQKQKEKTHEALVAWMAEEAARQTVYLVWEDLHWIDPSSLEVLTLILQQVPTSRALVVLTYRPDFTPPWRQRAHGTQLTLSRLGRQHVTEMVNQVMATTMLSAEVVQQIVSRTDGVPLFVEELTKSVAEAVGVAGRSPLQLAIPTTLHDSLMARLDRLGTAKVVAQLGATLGREFSHDLLQAVSPVDATVLQQAIQKLIDAELLYQRGLPPQATYLFKHALIQDTAYQSLLKSTRQQYHHQIAQVFEAQFPQTTETQPELVAHHYTEAGLAARGIPYWQQAGQQASQRSAHVEAISHLTKGIELLNALPDTPERAQQELSLQMALGAPLMATKGLAASEAGKAYDRARELCQQLGETPQLFPVLRGLSVSLMARAEHRAAREFAERCLRLAQSTQDSELLMEAHYVTGNNLFYLGMFAPSRDHFEQSISLYDSRQHHSHAFLYGQDTQVVCLARAAWILCFLGYSDQGLKLGYGAITLARKLSHPHSLAYALSSVSVTHQARRESQAVQEQAEAAITLATEQGFTQWIGWGTVFEGWADADLGRRQEGIVRMRRGLAAYRSTGAQSALPYLLALLAEAYEKAGQVEEGLTALAEGLEVAHKNDERWYEAELYRLKGELVLQSGVRSLESENPSPQHLTPSTQAQAEAEACFLKAIDIARKQQAKSLELRATMSLARLWQHQGKRAEAHTLLSEIYHWFTEGFDTKDLQEAKALLEKLSH